MSLLVKGGGITKLSEIIIDADKDWQAMGISNIKEVAAAMPTGNMISHSGAVVVALSPGPVGTHLTTQGIGADPTWSHV